MKKEIEITQEVGAQLLRALRLALEVLKAYPGISRNSFQNLADEAVYVARAAIVSAEGEQPIKFDIGDRSIPPGASRRFRDNIGEVASESGIQLAPSRKKRLYLAGPMTGLPDLNFPAFNAAAAALRERGYHVENPAEHGIVEGAEWGDYLRYDIGRLVTCEGIALLPGWFDSKGARLEVNIAQELGMEVILLDNAETTTMLKEHRREQSRSWRQYTEIMHRHVLRHNQMMAARRDSEMRAQLAAGDVVESDLPAPHDAAEEREAILDKIRTPGQFPTLDEMMKIASEIQPPQLPDLDELEEAMIKATNGLVSIVPLGKKTVEVTPPWRAYLLGALGILRGGWDTGNVDEAVAQCIDHLNACLGEEADHG